MTEKETKLLILSFNAIVGLLTLIAASVDPDAAIKIQSRYKADILKLIQE